jgi:hypothetical protein
MLADQNTFPHVGNPKAEVATLPLFTAIVPDAMGCTFHPIFPKDAVREVFAKHLCNTVFDFVVVHELTHIAHGHVDYANQIGLPFVNERSWRNDKATQNLESQAMEMDADFKAAELVVKGLRRYIYDKSDLPPKMADFYRDPAEAMFHVAAAISIQARLFGDTRLSLSHLGTLDHPPDRWRQLMVLNAMGNHAEQFWGESNIAAVMASVSRAIEEVEEAFERITGQSQQVEGLHDVWHGDGWKYAEAVSTCWNDTMRIKLKSLALEELPIYSFDLPE